MLLGGEISILYLVESLRPGSGSSSSSLHVALLRRSWFQPSQYHVIAAPSIFKEVFILVHMEMKELKIRGIGGGRGRGGRNQHSLILL